VVLFSEYDYRALLIRLADYNKNFVIYVCRLPQINYSVILNHVKINFDTGPILQPPIYYVFCRVRLNEKKQLKMWEPSK
jgi:hypothetical protein